MIEIIRAWLHNVEPATLAGLTVASKDFGTIGTGEFDTVIAAYAPGAAGNDLVVVLLPDAASAVSVALYNSTVFIHYTPGTSTVADVEAAITAFDAAVIVATPGTGATVLSSVAAGYWASLTGGTDSVVAQYPVVVAVDAPDPRPVLPYYVAAWGAVRSLGATDEQQEGVARGVRVATVTITGYGDGVADFLETAILALSDDVILAAVHAAGGAIDQAGPIIRTSAMRDTAIEAAYAVDVFVTYKVDRVGADVVEVERIEVAVTLDGDMSSTIVWEA